MSLRRSTGYVNALAYGMGEGAILNNMKINVYTGAQPASANDAPTGTLLCTFSLAAGSYTAEARATTVIGLTGGASGQITQVSIGGVNLLSSAVAFNTSLSLTAADLATAINNSFTYPDYTAVASGAAVIITAPKNSGANLNGLTVAVTATTITYTINGGSSTTLGGTGATAGAAAVNGLTMNYPPTSGIITKTTGAWQGTAVATGTAGWFRCVCSSDEDNTQDTTAKFLRLDGSIGTTGADMLVTSTSITSGATQTINTFQISVPQQ